MLNANEDFWGPHARCILLTFQLLASSFPDYKDRFATFFARCPDPLFVISESYGRRLPKLPPNAAPVKLPLRAVAGVLAFVESLRKKR